jgi:hypothetical protein
MSKRAQVLAFKPAVLMLVLLSLSPPAGAHHMVLRFNLEEMTETADRVFLGRCVAVDETEEMIAQGMMPVTRYTFEVERAIKGRVNRQITFRQLGHLAKPATGKGGEMTMHGRAVTRSTFIHGMSEYRVGDRLVLFLIPDYLGGKVTYPVGLYQGAFSVSRMPSGQELVRNSINNLGLFTADYNGTRMKASDAKVISPDRDDAMATAQGLSPAIKTLTRKRGALPLEPFLELLTRINTAHGKEKGVIVDSRKGVAAQ